jgi:hypothetical protein
MSISLKYPEMPQSPTSLDRPDEFAWLPIRLLQGFGFLPFYSKYRFQRIFCTIIAVLHLFGGYMGFTVQSLQTIAFILNNRPDTSVNSIVKAISFGQAISEFARAVIVVTLLFYTRNSYVSLLETGKFLTSAIFPDHRDREIACKRWKRLAVTWSVMTLTMHLTMVTAGYLQFLFVSVGVTSNLNKTNITLEKSVTSAPKEVFKFHVPRAFFDSMSYFRVLLFCLSQQVLVIIVVSAFAMRSFLKNNNMAMIKLREDLQKISYDKTKEHLRQAVQRRVRTQLETIRKHHWDILLFSDQLNSFFGIILFVAYGLDLITVLGYVANAIADIFPTISYQIFTGISILFFGFYATLFYLPLVAAHEEVRIRPIMVVKNQFSKDQDRSTSYLLVYCTSQKKVSLKKVASTRKFVGILRFCRAKKPS